MESGRDESVGVGTMERSEGGRALLCVGETEVAVGREALGDGTEELVKAM